MLKMDRKNKAGTYFFTFLLGDSISGNNIFLSFLFLFSFISCRRDYAIPEEKVTPPLYGISFNVPQGWPQPVYDFTGNPLTTEGFELGRKLFFETRLSKDNSISCGTCHQQFAAFANSAHDVSHGIYGLLGTRNAPGLFNQNWLPSFMWDGGINHLEIQPFAPITNPIEMDETMSGVIAKLRADANYRAMFQRAFGDTAVNSQRIFKAFAQFMGMLVSSNAKYDKVMRGEPGNVFTADEQAGYNLFQAKNCTSCHVPPLFSDFSFRNNGLAVNPVYNDSGRAHITGSASDRFKFKVPSLRNVEVSSPYMHDGRFQSLSQCLDHYSNGIVSHSTLDQLLSSGISLSTQEKNQLIAFLKTLTDREFLSDPRFQSP